MDFSADFSVDFQRAIADFAAATCDRVGQQLLDNFMQVTSRQASEKDDGSLITESDRWADATIREAIAQQFPDHGVLSEEGNHELPTQDWCWIVDPIDGTTNFSQGVPLWGISLGLLYRGHPVFGWLDFPPVGETYTGWFAGESGLEIEAIALCNDRPLQPNRAPLDGNRLFSFCSRSLPCLKPQFPCKVRMLGVASYNLLTVAAGTTLGALEATPKVWDLSAVWVISQAAGVVWEPLAAYPPFPITVGENYGQRPNPCLVVARPELLEPLRSGLELSQLR
jgi:myo-inositol-1(or 4)-monophosphatase